METSNVKSSVKISIWHVLYAVMVSVNQQVRLPLQLQLIYLLQRRKLHQQQLCQRQHQPLRRHCQRRQCRRLRFRKGNVWTDVMTTWQNVIQIAKMKEVVKPIAKMS